MGTLENPDGTRSSRRVMGVLAIVVGLILITAGFIIDRYPPFDIILLVLGCGSSLLGLTTFDNYLKNPKE